MQHLIYFTNSRMLQLLLLTREDNNKKYNDLTLFCQHFIIHTKNIILIKKKWGKN